MATQHTVIVELDPCPDCSESGPCEDCKENPELKYDVECPGVTDHCRAWDTCSTCYVPGAGIAADVRDQLEESGEAHGVQHQWIDGRWMTPTPHCYVVMHDAVCEEARYASEDKPGRYLVTHEVGDGTELFLHLVSADRVSG